MSGGLTDAVRWAALSGLAMLGVLTLIWRWLAERRQLLRALEAELLSLGLARVEGGRRRWLTLAGRWGERGALVRIDRAVALQESRAIELRISGVLPGVTARLLDYGAQPRRDNEPRVGDARFDGSVGLTYENYDALVRLSPAVREALRLRLRAGWTLTGGDLHRRVVLRAAGPLAATRWKAGVHELLAAARDAPSTLAQRLAIEPEIDVRVHLLAALADFGDDFVRRALPASALSDPAAPVRALAAALLQDHEAWHRSPTWARDQVVELAPRQLVALLRARRDEAGLIGLLSRRESAVLDPVIDALADLGSRDAVGALHALIGPGPLAGRRSEAAKRAILQIQARLQGAERGQISITDAAPTAGAVQVVGEGGEIGLVGGGRVTVGE